jgi:Tfp pilus assembly protein PilO
MKLETKIPETIFGIETRMISLFIPPLGLLLVVLMSVGLLLMPRVEEINKNNTLNKKLKGEVADLTAKYNYLANVNQEELMTNSDFINKSILPEKNAYLLVGTIRKIADKHGYYLDSFSVSPGELETEEGETEVVKGNVMKIPLTLNLMGSKDNYMDLVVGIEKSLPILSLDEFEMEGKLGYVEIRVKLSANYIPKKEVFKIENLSLTDMTLSQKEMDLLTTLKTFEDNLATDGLVQEGGEFVKYDFRDPFTQ